MTLAAIFAATVLAVIARPDWGDLIMLRVMGGPVLPQDASDFTYLDEGGVPLNTDLQIVSAHEAEIDDSELVMGVVIAREARAYPVNYMLGPYNEIVNDVLGGRPIAPSW